MPLTRTESLDRLAWMVASDSFPQLDTTALQQLIDDHARWELWTASSSYEVGDIIVPTVRNGRLYQVIIAGTSGTTEPLFPTLASNNFYIIVDGTSDPQLTWRDIGPANNERYDLRSSARQGWLRKASAVTTMIDSKDGQVDVKMSALHDHCIAQANRFAPLVIY